MSRAGPHLGLLAVAAIWGAAFIAVKALQPPVGPLDWIELAWLRYASASLLFLTLAAAVDARALADLARRRPGRAFLTGIFGVAGYNLALNFGESQLPATLTLLIVLVNPVLTLALSRALFGEKVSKLRWAGSALAAGGLALVLWAAPRSGGGWGPRPCLGLAAVLAAAGCWTAYTLLGKSLMADASPLAATALSTVLGTLSVLPVALAASGGDLFRWQAAAVRRLDGGATLWLAYLVVVSTLLAFILYLWGLKRLSAGTASAYLYLMPVFGLGWGRLALGERVSGLQLAGAAVLLAGVGLASGGLIGAGAGRTLDGR